MRTTALLIAILVVAVTACSSDDLTETQEEALITEDGITARQTGGVGPWIFTHDPDAFNQALHTGAPEVRDNCLYVDDTIVIWHESDAEYAEQLVADTRAGTAPNVKVPGGGISIDEGASPVQIPKTVRDRCPTNAVWFAGPIE